MNDYDQASWKSIYRTHCALSQQLAVTEASSRRLLTRMDKEQAAMPFFVRLYARYCNRTKRALLEDDLTSIKKCVQTEELCFAKCTLRAFAAVAPKDQAFDYKLYTICTLEERKEQADALSPLANTAMKHMTAINQLHDERMNGTTMPVVHSLLGIAYATDPEYGIQSYTNRLLDSAGCLRVALKDVPNCRLDDNFSFSIKPSFLCVMNDWVTAPDRHSFIDNPDKIAPLTEAITHVHDRIKADQKRFAKALENTRTDCLKEMKAKVANAKIDPEFSRTLLCALNAVRPDLLLSRATANAFRK